MNKPYIDSSVILKREPKGNKKETLIVHLLSVDGSWYLASLTKRIDDSSMDSWKISRMKKGKPILPIHPYKKCRLCDKNHFIGDCQFTNWNTKQDLLTAIYKSIRLKSLWS